MGARDLIRTSGRKRSVGRADDERARVAVEGSRRLRFFCVLRCCCCVAYETSAPERVCAHEPRTFCADAHALALRVPHNKVRFMFAVYM